MRGKEKSRKRKEDNNKIKHIYEITAALSRLLNSHVVNTLQHIALFKKEHRLFFSQIYDKAACKKYTG